METVKTLRVWFIAARPWSCTTAIMPVCLGAALAWHKSGELHPLLFLLCLIAAVSLHLGTNYMNTYGDYRSGVDTKESAKTCPELVNGTLSPAAMRAVGLSAMALAALLGLILTALTGWPLLLYGLIGLLGAYCYTGGFWPYKYKGLGPPLVFLLMGPLMVAPSYYIQTGQTDIVPFLGSLPIAFLVTAIIQGNDLRDIDDDRRSGITTMALYLGLSKAFAVYRGMFAGAYLSLFLLMLSGIVPLSAVITVIALPGAIRTLRAYDPQNDPPCLDLMVVWSAGFHFRFGALYISGILLDIAWRHFYG